MAASALSVIGLIAGAGLLGARLGSGESRAAAGAVTSGGSPSTTSTTRPPGMQSADYPVGIPDRSGELLVELSALPAAFSSITTSPLIVKDLPLPIVKRYPAVVGWNFVNPIEKASCRSFVVSGVRIDGFVQRALTNDDLFALVYVQRLGDPAMAVESFVGQSLELGVEGDRCAGADETGVISKAESADVTHQPMDLGDLGDARWNTWASATNPVPGYISSTAIVARGKSVVRVDVTRLQGGNVTVNELRDIVTRILVTIQQ